MAMQLLVIAAFALAAVTPFMSGTPNPSADAGYSEDADDAAQPVETEPDGD
jgi:hypothetical protein